MGRRRGRPHRRPGVLAPYLFDSGTGEPAPRPAITSAPQQLAYGGTFSVGLADGGAIAGVHLVRAGSSTHGTNTDQRFLALPFTQAGASLSVDAPPRGHDAPPARTCCSR